MSDYKFTGFRFLRSSSKVWRNICRATQFQGHFDFRFLNDISRRKEEVRVRGKFNPSPADRRARYDNRILVSRFVTSLPEGNIIPANLKAAIGNTDEK